MTKRLQKNRAEGDAAPLTKGTNGSCAVLTGAGCFDVRMPNAARPEVGPYRLLIQEVDPRRLQIDVGGELGLQDGDQLGVHERVVVGDAQRDQALAGERFGEAFAQAVGVLALHAEDEVGPAEVAGGDLDTGAVLRAGRACGIARMVFKQRLGRRAAPLIARADEEEVGLGGGRHGRQAGDEVAGCHAASGWGILLRRMR